MAIVFTASALGEEKGEYHPCHCYHIDFIDGNCIYSIDIRGRNSILINLIMVVEAKEAMGIHL